MIFILKNLFCFNKIWNDKFKMNKIVKKLLLKEDNFMPEFHLKKS